IEGIEMKLPYPVAAQLLDLLDRDRGGDQAACLGILIETVEALAQPRGNARPAGAGEFEDLRKARDREYPGNERRIDGERSATVTKAQEHPDVVEELRDGARCAGVDLALEVRKVRRRGRCLRVHLGIRRHRDVEGCERAQPGNQVGREREALGMRAINALPVRRIAAQRYQVADALIPVTTCDVENLPPGGSDAGEMRGAGEARLPLDASHDA